MNILIVDDEQPARQRLHKLVEALGHRSCGEAADGREALCQAQANQVDVVLLDISMPILDGLETARHLNQLTAPPAIIFTTAYDHFALAAFDAKAVDYLLKPVRQERLAEALERAHRLNRAQLAEIEQSSSHLCVKVGNRLDLVALEDIYYFQAEQKYVTLCHRQGEAILEDSLKSLEQDYGERFLRIHRNALVAPNHIRGLEKTPDGRYQVVFNEIPQRLEVSRRMVSKVRKLLNMI